jgi:hypothetical protein
VDSGGRYSQTGGCFDDVLVEARGPTDVDVAVVQARSEFVQSGPIESGFVARSEDFVEGSVPSCNEGADLIGVARGLQASRRAGAL